MNLSVRAWRVLSAVVFVITILNGAWGLYSLWGGRAIGWLFVLIALATGTIASVCAFVAREVHRNSNATSP